MTESRRPLSAPPPIENRPRAAFWLYARGVSNADVAALVGKSREQVRRYLLPFDHPDRRSVPAEVVATMRDWSQGELRADDWIRPPRPSISSRALGVAW